MLKQCIYHVCKWLGCFVVARRLTRRGLRILAYHGFILSDEGLFRPLLFMDVAVFEERMRYLVRRGYPVLSLGEAVDGLKRGDLPACATVITFDDGFYSIWKKAVPVLGKLNLPGTIYVTTYYSVKGNPIFRLTVQYMFWKSKAKELNLDGLGLNKDGAVSLTDGRTTDAIAWEIIDYAENCMNEDERVRLCEELGRRLKVDYGAIVKDRILALMTAAEIQEAAKMGVDIQLHTHRHVLPIDAELVKKEIEDNREVLEPLVGRKLHHFCYPSGVRHQKHKRPLKDAAVMTATTCDFGLNFANTPSLTLHRFLDGNNVSWIEFEAEMSGFGDLLRRGRSLLVRPASRSVD